MSGVSRLKKFRYRLEWLGCLLFAKAVPLLPRRWCLKIAERVGDLAYRLDRRGRHVAEENLRCAFRERYSPEERQRIIRQSYRTFARTMFDLFWAQNLHAGNWREHIVMEGDLSSFQVGQGLLVMCIHWGNFEWAGLSAGFMGRPSVIVAENFKNPLLGPVFCAAREISGNTIIPQENSMIRLLKVVKRKGTAGMLADLTLPPSQAAVPITAFGMKMSVPFLHAVLILRGGATVAAGRGEPLPDGRTRVIVDPPLAFPPEATYQEVTQAYWNLFEEHIRQQPEHWMWFYKHWRYRPREARPEDYPSYANVSSKFEKLLREHGC